MTTTLRRFHQRTNRVTSDIAGAAGDKHAHELTHSRSFRRCYPDAVKSGFQHKRTGHYDMLRIECANGARTLPMGNMSADRLQLIVPNLHGAIRASPRPTACWRRNLPDYLRAWLGPDAPDGIARLGVAELLKLRRRRAP